MSSSKFTKGDIVQDIFNDDMTVEDFKFTGLMNKCFLKMMIDKYGGGK